MRKIYTLFLLLTTICNFAEAQDPSFSQFYANRIYLNPAFTGLESGISFAGVSRMQWTNVDSGFRTYGMSVEIQEPNIKSGFGLSLFHDTQGLAQLNTTSIGLSYSYTIPMENNNIHFGLQARWVQKSVDWSKIVFSDQLDPVHGNIYSTSAVPVLDRVRFSDFDVGVVWRSNTDLKIGKRSYRDVRSSVGVSIHHLPSLFNKSVGNESLQNLNTQTAARITFHAGSVIPLVFFGSKKKEISISPNLKVDLQGENMFKFQENLQVFTYGAYFLYDGIYVGALYQNKQPLSSYRNTNAWILAFGAYLDSNKKNKYFIGFSYDANTTGVGTRAGGVYEIAFRWTGVTSINLFGPSRSRRNKRFLNCFRFF